MAASAPSSGFPGAIFDGRNGLRALFVPKAVANGLAVGQTATLSCDGGLKGRSRNGMPKEVYAGKKLLLWCGVKL